MLRYARFPAVRHYRVEVSGWDAAGNFFVENCDLRWSEESGKLVVLNRKLNRSTVLFVRLLDPGQTDRPYPVVYEAEWVGEAPNGMGQFRLSAMVPGVRAAEGAPL